MAFRKDESTQQGFERAKRYLIPKELEPSEKKELEYYIDDLTIALGPVVACYPSWHPLVLHHDGHHPHTRPRETCGYKGLDHNLYFAHGFITCPYHGSEEIINSVNELSNTKYFERYSHVASIHAERIDKPLYATTSEPVLITCEWHRGLPLDKTIPKNIAVGLMLEMEAPAWRRSEVGETWENMRPYLLGEPCGKRSSIFLGQEAGQSMKKVYEAMIYSGMYGPLKV